MSKIEEVVHIPVGWYCLKGKYFILKNAYVLQYNDGSFVNNCKGVIEFLTKEVATEYKEKYPNMHSTSTLHIYPTLTEVKRSNVSTSAEILFINSTDKVRWDGQYYALINGSHFYYKSGNLDVLLLDKIYLINSNGKAYSRMGVSSSPDCKSSVREWETYISTTYGVAKANWTNIFKLGE